MVNQEYYNLGTAPSVIRQLFAYGLEQAKIVGPEKVYDYSLGNPSIPAPKAHGPLDFPWHHGAGDRGAGAGRGIWPEQPTGENGAG